MAITYAKVKQEVANLLGAVAGHDAALAEANYTAAISTSTVIGPDFTPSMIEDAIVDALGEIVEAIASTPLHPERIRFNFETGSLANFAELPRTVNSSTVIGVPGYVRDSSDNTACLPTPLDAVRSVSRFPAIYDDGEFYGYAINSGRIEHTRAAVVVEVCIYSRPTDFSGAIDCDDHHEGGLVQGAVAKLAPKEGMYADLYASANAAWAAHLAEIRGYRDPSLYGRAQGAPSSN